MIKGRFLSTFILLAALSCIACKKAEFTPWDGDHNLSVMSFNLRYDTEEDGDNQWNNRKEACVKMIQEVAPAVLCIQEGLLNQVTYLDEHLNQYSYYGVGRDDGYTSGEYSAVFYRNDLFELNESGEFWLSETPETPSLGWDANNIRIVTWSRFKTLSNNKSFLIFNTHFDHKGKIAQEESARLLADKISEINTTNLPVFIAGDFNLLVGNSKLKPITDNYESSRETATETDKHKSFNAWGRKVLNRNIDFIFYNNAKALKFGTVTKNYGPDYISDHYPIISYFSYK